MEDSDFQIVVIGGIIAKIGGSAITRLGLVSDNLDLRYHLRQNMLRDAIIVLNELCAIFQAIVRAEYLGDLQKFVEKFPILINTQNTHFLAYILTIGQ
jgi:hypothetical protein